MAAPFAAGGRAAAYPSQDLAELRIRLAAAVGYAARRMWRLAHLPTEDEVILDLLCEALVRMGELYRPREAQPAASALASAPRHIAQLIKQVEPLAVRCAWRGVQKEAITVPSDAPPLAAPPSAPAPATPAEVHRKACPSTPTKEAQPRPKVEMLETGIVEPDIKDSSPEELDSDEERRLFQQALDEAPPTIHTLSEGIEFIESFLAFRGWAVEAAPGETALPESDVEEILTALMGEDVVTADLGILRQALHAIFDARLVEQGRCGCSEGPTGAGA